MPTFDPSPVWSLIDPRPAADASTPSPCKGTTCTTCTTGTVERGSDGADRHDAEAAGHVVPVVHIVPISEGYPPDPLDQLPPGFELIEVDPDEIPLCRCGRTFASQGVDGTWRCGHCDADEVTERRQRTERWLRTVGRLRRNDASNNAG